MRKIGFPIAKALAENIPVVTSDPKFRLYEGLSVIWQATPPLVPDRYVS
jgi:hypothetical protein